MRPVPAPEPPLYTFTLSRWQAMPVVFATFLGLALSIQGLGVRVPRRDDPMVLVFFLVIIGAGWVLPIWLGRRFGARPRVEWRGGLAGGLVIAWDDLLSRDPFRLVFLVTTGAGWVLPDVARPSTRAVPRAEWRGRWAGSGYSVVARDALLATRPPLVATAAPL